MLKEYNYWCPECEKEITILHSVQACDDSYVCGDCHGEMGRVPGACAFNVNGMNAAGGYSDSVADIEKYMGRPIENHDLDKKVSTAGKIND